MLSRDACNHVCSWHYSLHGKVDWSNSGRNWCNKKWNLFGVCHAKIPLLSVSHSVLCFSVLVKQNLKQGVRKLRPCRNCLKLKYSGQRIRVWGTNHSCYGAVRSSPCQPRRAFEILISGDLQIWLQCLVNHFLIQLSLLKILARTLNS